MTHPRILVGDLLDVLPTLPDGSIDAVATDPPYGLEFMGKAWDTFRVDDPGTSRNRGDRAGDHGSTEKGGTGLRQAAGVTYGNGARPRTSRCTGCGKRDQFRNPHACPPDTPWALELIAPHQAPPTSLAFGEWVRRWSLELYRVLKPGGHVLAFGGARTYHRLAAGLEDAGFDVRDSISWLYGTGFPKSMDLGQALTRAGWADDVAAAWAGWGTSLKPGHEPIVVARRPMPGPLVHHLGQHGVGGLNIAATRIPYADDADLASTRAKNPGRADLVTSDVYGADRPQQRVDPAGRYPTNVVLSHAPTCTGTCSPGCPVDQLGDEGRVFPVLDHDPIADGPAFLYTAKPTDDERDAGLEADDENDHPTVKPVALMRWLLALVVPPGGTVLDPFLGSGTTAVAAELDGIDWVGIELDTEEGRRYQAIAADRIAWATSARARGRYAPPRRRRPPEDQPSLFG